MRNDTLHVLLRMVQQLDYDRGEPATKGDLSDLIEKLIEDEQATRRGIPDPLDETDRVD